MRFSILGPVQVTDGRDRVFVRAPQDRKLLALLVLHANRVVSRDEIIDALWGESPPSRAVNAVHSYGAYLWDTIWPTGLAMFYPHPEGGISLPQKLKKCKKNSTGY